MPPAVFISYSHKDEDWKDRLLEHLGVLEEEGLLQTWNDRSIGAGDEWFEEIQDAMNAARVAVFLVSAASLKSKFIRHKEIPHLLDRREKEGMTFFPVIVKSCVWGELPWLSRFQARPRDGKPLADFRGNRRDAELAKIAKEILEIVRNGTQPLASPKPAAVAISSTPPALHQLTTPPADFTGREEDLEALRSALAQGGTGAIFGLRGLGGVGKTTLALKLAEELTPRYPDAQLYLNLKGVDPEPLTASQAMAYVIRSFRPEAQLPKDGTALANLYRSVLFGKSALLLMDNAASREQVEPLIPHLGALLLVTSRFRFTLPGLVARDLDEMSKEDARDLLLKMAPRIGSESDEIARLCGWLPLALRLAGSTLAERLDLSSSEYARRLREGKERLDPVEASLNLSYELLNSEQQRLLQMLAAFSGTFRAKAAAEIWGLEIDPAKEALWKLVRCSLVEWEEKVERYRLHDLVRQFTDRQAIKFYEQDLSTARSIGDREREATALSDLGDAYARLGEFRRAIDSYEEGLTLARDICDLVGEADVLDRLGNAYDALGDSLRAIEFHEQQLAITRHIDDRFREGSTLGNLGKAYVSLGEPRRAIEFYEQWLAIARDTGNRRGEGRSLGSLGIAYAELGESRRAIEFFERQRDIACEIGDRRGEANASWNLGLVYEREGELTRAADLMQVCVDFEREIGHSDAEKHAARVQAIRDRIAGQS